MSVQYTQNALEDLSGIITYIAARNPSGSDNVHSDVRAAIGRLSDHPFSGRQQDEEHVRRIVSPGYRYAIYYHLDQSADLISILAILHPAREQPFRST